MTHVIIVVPEALPYADFSSYLLTITSDEFFGYTLVTIIIAIVLLSTIRFIQRKKILFFQSVADILNLLMCDNGGIDYRQLYRTEALLICTLTFVGIVVVNGILSNLQSYVTDPFLQPQIKSIEDIYTSQFNIATESDNLAKLLTDLLNDLTEHKDWSKKIFSLGTDFFTQFLTYNTSLSYLTYLDDAKIAFRAQTVLNIKGYYNPKIQIAHFLSGYYVNRKFLFLTSE